MYQPGVTIEDEIDLQPQDEDTISISSSIATSNLPYVKLGVEKTVKFKGDQDRGEREARNYILANLEYHDLQDAVSKAPAYDDRLRNW